MTNPSTKKLIIKTKDGIVQGNYTVVEILARIKFAAKFGYPWIVRDAK